MRTVWKYPLTLGRPFTLLLPIGARFLHCGEQGHVPHAWYEVDPGAGKEQLAFALFPTGTGIPANSQYLGTIVEQSLLVWHLYRFVSSLER